MASQRQKQLRSSTACRRRLDDLYMPILERMDNGEFSEEGGSDAYDRAMAELRDAYQATPNLGCMMNEEWETFIRSHTLDDQVEIEDLDEPDEQATNQQGTYICQPGNDTGIRRLPSGEIDPEVVRRKMQEVYINSIGDPNTRSEVAKVIMVKNMDAVRNSSSIACRARLEELFQPIEDRKENGAYKGEEGHALYQVHLEKVKREYQDTPDLGVMKGTELTKFIENKKDASELITEWDKKATGEAEEKQNTILRLLVKMNDLFQQFRETFQKWIRSRSDNTNWLELKAASLDEKQKQTNEGILATTWLSGASTVVGTGIVIYASLLLVPVTFGASLAVGGAGFTGISTGMANFKQRNIQRKYDLDAIEEAKKRLLEDKELSEKLVSIVKSLESHRREIIKVVTTRCKQESTTDGHVGESATDGDFKEVGELNSMALSAQSNFRSEMPVLAVGAGMGVQIADDVLDTAKLSMTAAKQLGAVVAVIGGVSLAWDIYTLIQTKKDIAAGSKSKIGKELRAHAEEMKEHVKDVCRRGKQEEDFVNQAQRALNALMKRYPLTVRHPDMN